MRDDHQRAVVPLQEVDQPVDRVEVEVVGGLVEQQRAWRAEERLGQQHPHLLAALQFRHLPLVQRLGDVEAVEQDGGVALGRVAVVLADGALELAEAHAVLVAERRLGVEQVPLLQGAPQGAVAHDHGVDHPERIERELVLAEHPEPVGAGDTALLRRDLAGEQLHERRLAGAVRPGQAVAAPRREHGGHVVEEHLVAEPHRDAADRDHREAPSVRPPARQGGAARRQTSDCTSRVASPRRAGPPGPAPLR